VSHSDVRINDNGIDTTSGMITRLFAPNFTSSSDIVTGLPRSKEDHAPNGVAFGPDGKLYVAVGGMTNAGVPSGGFFNVDETATSSAVLQVDLASPTPVVYATGFRNPYDLLFHSNGKLYVNDNGPNADQPPSPQPPVDWGVKPKGNGDCSGSTITPQTSDKLNLVVSGGYYGHPNPARSECDFQSGPFYTPPLHNYGIHTSSDGIAEFTSSVLPGLQGQILTANFGALNNIATVKLNGTGTQVVAAGMIRAGLNHPVDVAVRASDGAVFVAEFGSAVSVLLVKQAAPVDFTATRQSSLTVFRPSTAEWYIRKPDATWSVYAYGSGGDLPHPADYDGDGKADLGLFRPSDAKWYIATSSSNYVNEINVTWGAGGDIPVPGDYDGDGRADLAVFRPSDATWYIRTSSSGYTAGPSVVFGAGVDIPVPADYDGDGHADIAVFRPSNATWFMRTWASGYTSGPTVVWGAGGDVPLALDYDGDGLSDIVVFRPSDGNWYVRTAASGFTTGTTVTWGVSGDIPLGRN
jgi:hypothetical protein